MSSILNNKNNTNNNSSISGKEEKGNNKSSIELNKSQNESINYNNSKNLNNSKTINNSTIVYPYPICLHNEKDPIDEYKLRIIKARNKGSDTFLKNYLNYNFSKNDINNNSINNSKNIKENAFENNKNNLFITEDKKNFQISKSKSFKKLNPIKNNNKSINVFTHKKTLQKSQSDIFDQFSQKAINHYKTLYLIEMEKRGNLYNKRRMASLQRIALHNFSSMNLKDNHYVNGSIPSGKSDESYILETKKRKKLPGIREYICYRLKNMKEKETNTPEYYLAKYKKYEKNKLPEMIDIKNNGRFKFHVFHDQYGFRKELDKRNSNKGLKMTKDRIRDLKVMSQINKIKDPDLIDTYKRALYEW